MENRTILFSYGFRPFFLLAMLFASVAIVLWMGIFEGNLHIAGPFSALDWHIQEMLFGYTSAVMAGFIFTALPNWTGRKPVQGWPLALLALLWLAGRVCVAGLGNLPANTVLIIDCAFLALIGLLITKEIIAAKNWRNLMVVVPIAFFFVSNVLFHIEAAATGGTDISRRLGFSAVLTLVMLIGGRIIPAFTRNWLAKSQPGPMPVQFNRFDALAIVTTVFALLIWTIWPDHAVTGYLLIAAAAVQFLRLLRWQGHRTFGSPLLLMLHVAFAFVPAGFLTLGLGNTVAGYHLLGIGAVGGMSLAVMMRASLGHTGHPLNAGFALGLAFSLLICAALIRAFLPDVQIFQISGLWGAALFWTLAYLCAIARLGPWLVRPKRS
jgi:uncharacterized protein involved in response to NO